MQQRLIQRLFSTAQATPNKLALVTDKSQLSFQEFLLLIQVLDMQLKTRGVREGQTIVLDVQRGDLCLAFCFLLSLRSLNVIFAPSALVRQKGLRYDRVIASAPPDGVPPEKLIVIEPEWFSIMGSVPHPDYSSVSGDGGSFVTPTSGTTGRPKLVQTPENSRLSDMMAMLDKSQDDLRRMRFMTTASAHTGWAMNTTLPVLLAGGSVVSLGSMTQQVLPFVDMWRVSHLSVTPSVLQDMIKLPTADQYLTAVEEIEIGGAFTPRAVLEKVSSLCPARLVTSFGATETGALCRRVYDPDLPNDDLYLGEICRDDVEFQFLADQHEVASGDEGILAVKLPDDAPRRYLLGANETDDGVLDGSRFLTGDVIRRDGNRLYLIGRQKRVLNLNGNKFSLDAIQTALAEHLPEGAEIAALSSRDADGLEQLALFIACDSGPDIAGLENSLQTHWRKLRIGRLEYLDALPRTPSGKIDFGALSAR